MHEIDLLADTFRVHDSAPGTPWDDFKDSFLALPEWFRFELDPLSPKYEQQQRRLWGLIAGVDVPYDPNVHEKEAQLSNVDAIRFPGHFVRRDPQAVSNAAEHLLATDRKSTRLNSSHSQISYAVFCLKKKNRQGVADIDHLRLIASHALNC